VQIACSEKSKLFPTTVKHKAHRHKQRTELHEERKKANKLIMAQ